MKTHNDRMGFRIPREEIPTTSRLRRSEPKRGPSPVSRRATAFLTVLAALCLFALVSFSKAWAQASGEFSGSWTANGTVQPLDFGDDREVFLFRLSGHVNLKSDVGSTSDYWSDCVGIWDSETGVTARCAWRHVGGNGVAYIIFEGRMMEEGATVQGKLVGGEGNLEGLEGTMTFTWSTLYRGETDKVVTCHSKDIKGTYRIP